MTKTVTSRGIRFSVIAALIGVFIAALPASVSAYGTQHLFEITLSYNCQNVSICAPTPFGIGGLWGWVEPDTGGMVDGSLAFQGHQNSNPLLNGTGHSTGFVTWSVINCSSGSTVGDCALLGPEGTPIDPNAQYFDILTEFGALGALPVLTPATPGHYSLKGAPGVSSEATVTQLH